MAVEAADYENETKAAVRRLFEAWKRALDATIEVPDREPAINALSSPSSCRRKREGRIQGEDRGGRIEKRARQRYSEGAKTVVERAGFVCL